MRIWLQPDRMTAYALTTTDVIAAIREQNVATAAGTIGGQPNSGDVKLTYPVSAEGRLQSAEEFAVQKLAHAGRLDSFKKALKILAPKLQILRSAKSDESPLSKFSMTYVRMVLLLLNYIRALRPGD